MCCQLPPWPLIKVQCLWRQQLRNDVIAYSKHPHPSFSRSCIYFLCILFTINTQHNSSTTYNYALQLILLQFIQNPYHYTPFQTPILKWCSFTKRDHTKMLIYICFPLHTNIIYFQTISYFLISDQNKICSELWNELKMYWNKFIYYQFNKFQPRLVRIHTYNQISVQLITFIVLLNESPSIFNRIFTSCNWNTRKSILKTTSNLTVFLWS